MLFNLLVAILVEGFSSERQEREQRQAREKQAEERKGLELAQKMGLLGNELPNIISPNGGTAGTIINATTAVTSIDSPPIIHPVLTSPPLKNNNHHHNSHNHSGSKYQPAPGCSTALVPVPAITHTAATPEVSVVLRD